jgi:hypothetical protein
MHYYVLPRKKNHLREVSGELGDREEKKKRSGLALSRLCQI